MTFPGTYVLRRLLIALPSLLGISVVLFTVLALAPGDPFGELVSNPNVPAEVAAALRHKFGMDDPIAVRYLHWLAAMLQGDWGFSFASRINVDTLIMQRLPTTIVGQLIVFETLAALAYAFALRGAWPPPETAAGIALLVAGVVWALRRPAAAAAPQP